MTTRISDRTRFSFQFFAIGTTNLVDHSDVTVIHRNPAGVETVYTLIANPTIVFHDGVGSYHADILIDLPRRHYFRAIGADAPNEKSTEIFVDVPESAFAVPIPP